MESILSSIKKLLGIADDYVHFDMDIIMHINSVLAVLTQLGIGPPDGFVVKDDNDTWESFISDTSKIEMIKSYVFLKVKLLFDPPLNSSVLESYNRSIDEFEWRLNFLAETTNE